MPLYTCELCNFSTKLKGNYKQHISSKKHRLNCGDLTTDDLIYGAKPEMSQNEPKQTFTMSQNSPQDNKKKFKCDYCESTFSSHASKRKHELHRCKSGNNLEKIIKELEKKHDEEKKVLYGKIEQLIDKVGDTTTNITNNTQNIILNSYGSEDLSHITDSIKSNLLKIPYVMIPKMIEAVHFNDDKPENKNIFLPNKKDNKIKVFQDNKWVYKNKEETIHDLVSGKYVLLNNHFENNKQYESNNNNNNMSSFIKTNYLKFRKYYDEGDSELLEQIKNECELVLLNNR